MAFDHHQHQLQAPLIHIGYPKALSSWMQKHLFKPEHGYVSILNSMESTISVIDPPPFGFSEDSALTYIESSLTRIPKHTGMTPVISAEALVGNPYCGGFNAKLNADRLKKLFPDGRILIVVREQKKLIRSLYKTLVTWGMPHSIKRLLNPVDTSLAPQFSLEFLHYDKAVAYYQHLFGKENVLVLPYEQFQEEPTQFLRILFHFAGQDPDKTLARLPVQKKVNANQTLLNLYIQRLHNLLFLSSPFNYAGLLPSTETRIHARLRRSKTNPFPKWMDNWFEHDFSQTVAKACKGEFGQSNSQLARLTGTDFSRYDYDISPDETSTQ